jgi:arabinofuranosyltransferase
VKPRALERAALVILTAGYVVWAGLFIYHSSYIAIDGHRYFGLFDDAMISMRYAWNFAHGLGLVWNGGERVEGYSNLLMTLVMSLASLFFDRRLSVLAVQILGIPTVLGAAWLARRITDRAIGSGISSSFYGILVFASVLFYYPLSYWTLMGMETGLLTLLILACAWFGIRWVQEGRRRDLISMSIAAGLAFLTRNDSVILSGVVFAYAALASGAFGGDVENRIDLLRAAALVAAFIIVQTAFRFAYYGALLPNTYILKLTGYPLNIRLIDGSRFVLEFLGQTWPIFVLAALAFRRGPNSMRVMLLVIMFTALAYQIYVGGDPWNSWRILAPGMPGLFILAAEGASATIALVPGLRPPAYAASLSAVLLLGALYVADLPFLPDMAVRGPTSAAIANRTNTNAAIAIDALTQPEASVGVIWAGTLPYYVDRYAVDYLGKSDAYIAHLKADVSGSSGWGSQISVPGHNKYDLDYSIVQRRPTYSQVFSWGYATVRPYFVENYVRVEYHGAAGTKTIFLLKDSPLVCWESCKSAYRLIPWPKQN